jgi:pheromone shutdown protein TraB
MTGFWKTWMTVWCWGVFVFGAALATAASPATDGVAQALYSLIGARPHDAAFFEQPGMRFSVGLMGAVSMGWALTLLAVIRIADAATWRALTGALLVWFVVDNVISVATGYPLNAVSNTLLVAAYLAPLLASGVLRGGVRAAT